MPGKSQEAPASPQAPMVSPGGKLYFRTVNFIVLTAFPASSL